MNDSDQKYVWMANRESMIVTRRNIAVEDGVGASLNVSRGLELGETSVAAGVSTLSEGMKVRLWLKQQISVEVSYSENMVCYCVCKKEDNMKTNKLICVICLIILVASCSPISRQINRDLVLGNINGMEKVEVDDKYTLVFKRSEFELASYSKFNIAQVRTIVSNKYPDSISAEDKLELEEYLREAMKRELTEGGYDVVETAGPDVLGIRFTLTDVDSGNPYLNVIQFYGPGLSIDVGGISIETEFFNTMNSQAQAIVVIGADGARKFSISSVLGKWGDVKKIFDDWAVGFRRHIDQKRKSLKMDGN